MITTIKHPLTNTDSLSTITPIHTATPLKSSFSTVSSNLPDILSTAVLHKRRPQKRVRFALKLESLEEDSLPTSREASASTVTKLNKRIIDPWRLDGPLHGTYVEYFEKQDTSTNNELQIPQISPIPSPLNLPEIEPPSYTHTFVIQSKSPEIVIDSITVSTPPIHLPRIVHPTTKKTNKQQLPLPDSYVKQQLTLSTPPRIIHTRKIINSSNQKNYYSSVHAALKRAEVSIPSTIGLHPNNKIIRSDNSFQSKFINDHNQTKKITEIITKPLPSTNNSLKHISERSNLSNYSKRPRLHNRINRINDELNSNKPYFFQKNNNDHLLQPIIHSPH